MRNSALLLSLLISLSACNQEAEQNKTVTNQPDTTQTEANQTTDPEKVDDKKRYPKFFIEVSKNLNISPQEFAQAMQKSGDHEASMENVAKELGISIEDLQAALPKPPPRKVTFEPAPGVEIIEETIEHETDVDGQKNK